MVPLTNMSLGISTRTSVAGSTPRSIAYSSSMYRLSDPSGKRTAYSALLSAIKLEALSSASVSGLSGSANQIDQYRYHTDDFAVKAGNPLWEMVCVNTAPRLRDVGRTHWEG